MWTRKPPTVDGLYWFRYDGHPIERATVVMVWGIGMHFLDNWGWCCIDEHPGWWWSVPLTPPTGEPGREGDAT